MCVHVHVHEDEMRWTDDNRGRASCACGHIYRLTINNFAVIYIEDSDRLLNNTYIVSFVSISTSKHGWIGATESKFTDRDR